MFSRSITRVVARFCAVLGVVAVLASAVTAISLVLSTTMASADAGVSVEVADTTLDLTGQTAPGAFVTVKDGDNTIATMVAGSDGQFSKQVPAQTYGIHDLQVYARSDSGLISDAASFNVNLRELEMTSVFAFLPTTLSFSGSDVVPGRDLNVHGETVPGGTVLLYIDQAAPKTVRVGPDGSWSLTLRAGSLGAGNHSLTSFVTDTGGRQSAPTLPRFFTIPGALPNPIEATKPAVTKPSPPLISLPKDNTVSTSRQVSVVGTSQPADQVEVWRNHRLMGSVVADKHGGWIMDISLQSGPNEIVTRACRDGVCGAFGRVLHVTYNPQETPLASQLRLLLETYRYTVKRGQPVQLGLSLSGGKEPFHYQIKWGEGAEQSLPIGQRQTTVSHSYAAAGTYAGKVTVQEAATDSSVPAAAYFSVYVSNEGGQTRFWSLLPATVAFVAVALIITQTTIVEVAAGHLSGLIRFITRK